jgi:hypothetical protein
MSKFTETIDLLKSASAWDKVSLQRFGVVFDSSDYTPLTTLISDPRYYDPDTEATDFALRIFPLLKDYCLSQGIVTL